MSCDLDVDTAAIRAAAAAAQDAAGYFAQPCRLPEAVEVRGAIAHGSASVREALRLTIRRTEQGLEAVRRLADLTQDIAGSLDAAAGSFDQAESLCRTGF
jgi:hypothetical protein